MKGNEMRAGDLMSGVTLTLERVPREPHLPPRPETDAKRQFLTLKSKAQNLHTQSFFLYM